MTCRLGPTRRRTFRLSISLLMVFSLVYFGTTLLKPKATHRKEASVDKALLRNRIHNVEHEHLPIKTSVRRTNNINGPVIPSQKETIQNKGTALPDLHSTKRQRGIPLVLIVSMMRSGTTFTGDVFRSYPDSVYFFEPMQYLTNNVGINNITFVNGTTRFYNRSQLHELHALTIINLLLCRFQDVPVEVFKTSHFLYHNHLRQFYLCVRGLKGDNDAMGTKCLPSLQQKCEKASALVIKLISVRMEAIAHVMNRLPEVYVIHLVRDPRPALLSQINVGQIDKNKIGNESESHCSNLQNDVEVTEKNICFRGNFYRQRYEDLAREPLSQFEGLFEFVNLIFHRDVQNRIRSIAMAKGVVKKCLYCADKGDAFAASQRWRSTAHFSMVTEIQKRCFGVMAELGYIQVNSSAHLKDTNTLLLRSDA